MSSPITGNIRILRHSALRASAVALIPLTLLTACGGGGGGSAPSAAPAAAAATAPAGPVSVLYSGTVAGLGSIVVNGVRFETIGAKVHESDDPYGSASYTDQIKLGMTVSVEGSADEAQGSGSAGTIRLDGGIRGQVSAIDTAANTLTVSGQKVKVDAKTTVYQGAAGLSGLSTASWVEVYGLPQSDGSFLATRVEAYASQSALAASYPAASTYPVSLRGIVQTSSANSLTLSSGDAATISVSYRASDVLPAGAAIANGSSVRVLATAGSGNSPVTAAKVLVLSAASLLAQSASASAASGVSVKLEGAVDSVGGNNIVVAGTSVDLSHALLPNGMPVKGQLVEVKGALSGGSLVAAKLEFGDRETSYTSKDGNAAKAVSYRQELYGTVSAYTPGGNSFTVQGVTVKVDSATAYEHGYSTLADNTYVEVKGVLDSGVLLASKVDVKGASASGTSAAVSGADAKSNEASAGGADLAGGSAGDGKLSSGGSSFESYGTLTCSAYPGNCSIAVSGGSTLKANLSAASWSSEHGGFVADSALPVEAKGYLDSAGVYQVTKIERKV